MKKHTLLWILYAFIHYSNLFAGEDLDLIDYDLDSSFLNKKTQNTETDPTPMASIEGEPSAFVHNCVNVITGQYCESSTDLIVHHGIDPLMLERSFSGNTVRLGHLGGGWRLNHKSSLLFRIGTRRSDQVKFQHWLFRDDQGGPPMIFERPLAGDFYIRQDLCTKGVANTSRGCISGQTNFLNYKCKAIAGGVEIKNGSKVCREYSILPKSHDDVHSLKKEINPTGNNFIYNYRYFDHANHLSKIEIYNQNNQSFSFLGFQEYTSKDSKKLKPLIITTNDGRWVKYRFYKNARDRYLLESVENSNKPTEEYGYQTMGPLENCFEIVRVKRLPEGRTLVVDYYEKGHNSIMGSNVHLQDPSDSRMYRVKQLRAPAGPDRNLIPIYYFVYDLAIAADINDPQLREVKHGTCSAFNALGHKTQYDFNEDQRLIAINKFHHDGQIYTQEFLFWGANQSKDNTCLTTRSFLHNSSCIFARNYQYDNSRNILVDSLYGNLTGNNPISPLVHPDGTVVENGCECYRKYRVYSEDGLNLLLKENDDLQTTTYQYAPNTNRLIAKFQGTSSEVLRRWFYDYNEDAAVTKAIIDDGCSPNPHDLTNVTERKITYYTQNTVYPVAYPLIIEEKYLDLASGQELLVHKVVNTYTNQAKISKQDHFDNQGAYAYSLLWEYDSQGNITKEVNAIAQTTVRRYDPNGNCIFEQEAGKDYHLLFTYDFMNRLIKEEQIHPDKNNRMITHRYDVASNKIATIDQNGNETRFIYDAFSRLLETVYPAVFDENQAICQPIIKKEYDPLSKVCKEIDARGVEKHMRYNIRGQLVEGFYPDGTTEKNSYNLNGSLIESKAKNNTITRYNYDSFNRPIQTQVFSPNEELLSSSRIIYNGFHILQEYDPSGVITHYAYYPDGKLKSQQKGDFLTTYFYDSLGRKNKTVQNYGANPQDVIITIQGFDLLNRLIEEKVLDGNDTIITKNDFAYDNAGNLIQAIKYNQTGSCITQTSYDTHGLPNTIIDAEGNKTLTFYHYDYRNIFGQIVAYKEIIDPLGNSEISISDALGRVTTNMRKNAFGKITQKQEKKYDLKGNLCGITDTIIRPNELEQEIIAVMLYDSSDRLTACYEAFGTPEQKQTKILYNSFGQKESLIKNDGIVLTHSYDALGRLKSLQSSDKSIHYIYEYDLNGNPIKIENLVNHSVTTRQYNENGYMLTENLANNLSVSYMPDNIGRTKEITYSDNSKVTYQYRSILLESINRINPTNQPIYSHQYLSYDLSGQVLKSTLAEKSGFLNYSYDSLGRLKSASSNLWNEQIKSYDKVGNILESTLYDSIGKMTSSFAYDDLYQIINETGSSTHAYSYDSHYNRLTKDGKKYRLNPLHQLLDDGTNLYSYDNNGNLKEKKSDDHTSSFTYDALDRLTTFTKDDQKTVYTYDENNRRLSKTFFKLADEDHWELLDTIRYLYQGQNEIGSVDQNGTVKELRVLGIGKGAEIGAAIAIELGSKIYIPLHDHIGNVACLIEGGTGEVTETYRYSSFGEELFEKALSPWRYSSKRVDSESGLIYFGRRYYDPQIGRWVTPDPIGREGGPNLYAYVSNGPLTHFDLYGLYGISDKMNSAINGFFNVIGNIASKLTKIPGVILSTIGQHLIPIPYVKDIVEFSGWCLEGKNPSNYTPGWKRPCSQRVTHEGYGHGDPHFRHVMYFGIGVTYEACKQRLANYSQENGGVTVYGLYNATQGFLLDSFEVLCQKLGIPMRAQQVANNETRRILNEMGEYKEGGKLIATAHSQGGETAYNLPPDVRMRMYVNAYGPARILQKKDFKEAQNFIGAFDPVPLLDPIGLIRGIRSGNVHYLPTSGCPIVDHYYDHSEFNEVRRTEGQYFKRSYGEVICN